MYYGIKYRECSILTLTLKSMPNKKTAKYIGFSLVSLSIATLLLTSIHSFKSYANNIYNVTKIASGLTID